MAEFLQDPLGALLPREDPSSLQLEDARHWLSVYRELVDFCDGMLTGDSADNDLLALTGRRRRLNRRLAAGLQREASSPPMDVLWFRISRRRGDPVEVFGKGASGQMAIFLNRNDYWQIAYIIPKASGAELEAEGIEAFRRRVAEMAPEYAERAGELKSWDDIKLLTVRSDRLRRWWKPGLLLIGDAAHAMSPVGGVGINLAIQDAVATYNLLAEPLMDSIAPDASLTSVQKRRRLPTYLTQRMQEFMQSVVMRRIKSGTPSRQIPWFAAMALRIRPLRNLGAYLIAVGFHPERVRSIQPRPTN
ncbi:MAG: FAD-dependent monooxygenase [Candidatus Dormibacteraeota bacterium]|uniref:FAD-dependent monooxygenase n=1 Tax=Candidatus Dormiibacter inghamiae TaxID=3127013 RepID=A0A934N6B5_9BACT|nr:FAD-dependent monooxygenase [Candidatus Dormibacteraeota bacterium]MBJ7604923.1 FAD-dependent monooxygenase [Candidatus Dormibacteraeota bacterium]